MKENKNYVRGSTKSYKYLPREVKGIYIIYHDITGEFYIGMSIDIGRRLSHHFAELKGNRGKNRFLQELYNNTRHEDFSFDYIELSDEEGYERAEEFLLAKHQEDGKCLNATYHNNTWVNNPKMEDVVEGYRGKLKESIRVAGRTGSKNPFYGKKHSDKTKKYLSESFMGREHNSVAEPVVINGKKYRTLQESSDNLGVHVTTISYRVNTEHPLYVNWYKYEEGGEVEVKDDRLLFDPTLKGLRCLYEIEGKYYYNTKDIAKDYNVGRTTVTYRVESENRTDWKRLI